MKSETRYFGDEMIITADDGMVVIRVEDNGETTDLLHLSPRTATKTASAMIQVADKVRE